MPYEHGLFLYVAGTCIYVSSASKITAICENIMCICCVPQHKKHHASHNERRGIPDAYCFFSSVSNSRKHTHYLCTRKVFSARQGLQHRSKDIDTLYSNPDQVPGFVSESAIPYAFCLLSQIYLKA